MKRWQTHREVLDSEDEDGELTLGSESSSPRRSYKKDNGAISSKSDLPGRAVSTVTSQVDPAETAVQETNDDAGSTSAHSNRVFSSPIHATKFSQQDGNPSPETLFEQDTLQRTTRKLKAVLIQPYISTSDEDTAPRNESANLTIDRQHNSDEEIRYESDSSLSILSERDVSPPPGFQFLNSATQLPATERNSAENSLSQWQGRRRNLRMRKDIQLHPYLLDRVQYLKQCRQRGMKPVRLQESWNSIGDGNDALMENSMDHERASSPMSTQNDSGTLAQEPLSLNTSLNYFDNLSQTSDTESSSHRLPKRRRIFSAHNVLDSPSDAFSFPPSPPRSGGQLGTPAGMPSDQVSSPRFRLPFGMTPVQMPTPQVSSELKRSPKDGNQSSDSESLPRGTSRLSTVTKPRQKAIVISSASETSSSDEPEVDQRRLRREQKRIKGVLPASWLRLDFRKQHVENLPSSTVTGHHENSFPLGDTSRKGVAQRIQRRYSHQQTESSFLVGSASEDESQKSEVESLKPSLNSRLSRSHDKQFLPVRAEAIDDGLMENDWIDPMFAGSSERAVSRKTKNPRRPRVTETVDRRTDPRTKFPNERLVRSKDRRTFIASSTRQRKTKAMKRRPRDPSVRLSIIDAPRVASSDESLPQFVRIALRHTRTQRNLGRHSPANKHVRLATENDTEDALSVLRAWREGTIKQVVNNRKTSHGNSRIVSRPSTQRMPLTERAVNRVQQQILSTPNSQSPEELTPVSLSKTRWPAQTNHAHDVVTLNSIKDSEVPISIEENKEIEGDKRHRQRKTKISAPARLRRAQVETLAVEFHGRNRFERFQHRMNILTENIARDHQRSRDSNVRIDRFLLDQNERDLNLKDLQISGHQPQHIIEINGGNVHRARKQRASRLDADAREYRQPNEHLPPIVDDQTQLVTDPSGHQRDCEAPTLNGLNAQWCKYTIDFDVRPLSRDVFFQQTTFIGSGEFHKSLDLSIRDLNKPTAMSRVYVGNKTLDWSQWTEDIASNLYEVVTDISSSLRFLIQDTADQDQRKHVKNNVELMLRSIIRYCSDHLWFSDPIDRQSCCESFHRMAVNITETVSDITTTDHGISVILTTIRQFALVIAQQTLQLCTDRSVDMTLRNKVQHLVLHNAESLLRCISPGKLEDLQLFHESMLRVSQREKGVSGDEVTLNTIVLLHYVLKRRNFDASFWQMVNASFSQGVSQMCDIPAMEKLWYKTYIFLPSLEISSTGMVKSDSKQGYESQDWSLIRSLLARVMELYENSIRAHGHTVNDYVRALLARCHLLVNKWGWWRCEQLLGTIYDFFARRGLAFLHNEESHGSPRFLDCLDESPSLDVEDGDCAFHIFLKILATGLRGMREHSIYNDRKIGGIAWRFIPSHGRTYRKDVELQTSDLDALRNHFDLLIVLYYASPPSHRPRVELLRNLVDHNASHREACRLSIRAWASIAAFQASTSESVESLQPLLEWFQDMFKVTAGQYRLARSEAEHDAEIAKQQGTSGVMDTLVEDTVARNQRQIAATLVDALAGLKRVIQCVSRTDVLAQLTTATSFLTVLELFDPSQSRLTRAVIEALSVAVLTLDQQEKIQPRAESQTSSDDSQGFGDSSALEELVAGETFHGTVLEVLHDPISKFVSNVLGADGYIDDVLVQSLIDLWIRLARSNVVSGQASWIGYIDDYSAHSWNRLRATVQKRKFTPYFMARVVENAGQDEEIKREALTSWVLSLVEREATLKYQHVLTSTLLKMCSDDALMKNLPFVRDDRLGLYRITLDDFRQRRLGLISTVFSNMRESCESAGSKHSGRSHEMRMRWATILKKLMSVMKANYQDLQANWDFNAANTNAQGAYVEFVQHVVSFLQQHTTEICPIDRFFTDSAAFPLPATDPTYVTGRLRSYVPKLNESKTRKQLAVFVQTVSERAAADAQQEYLVDQFTAAMASDCENGDGKMPTLRHVLLTSVFPAYYDNVIIKQCDWILAMPMLEASQHILDNLLYNLKIDDERSVAACVETIQSTVYAIDNQCSLLLSNENIEWPPQAFKVMSAMFNMGKACLTASSYIHRSAKHCNDIISGLHRLRSHCSQIERRMISDRDEFFSNFTEANPPCPWPDTRLFATNQIRNAVDSNWSVVDGYYSIRRGSTRKEVSVNLGDVGDERLHLTQAISEFSRAFDTIFDRRKWKGKGTLNSIVSVDIIV